MVDELRHGTDPAQQHNGDLVLLWDMVDTSSNSPRTHFKPVFRHWTAQAGHLFPRRGCIRVLLLAPSPTSSRQGCTGYYGYPFSNRAINTNLSNPLHLPNGKVMSERYPKYPQ